MEQRLGSVLHLYIQYLHLPHVYKSEDRDNQVVTLDVKSTDVGVVGLRTVGPEIFEESMKVYCSGLRCMSMAGVAIAMLIPAAAVFFGTQAIFNLVTMDDRGAWGRFGVSGTGIYNQVKSKSSDQKTVQSGGLLGGRLAFGAETSPLGVGLEGGAIQFEINRPGQDEDFQFSGAYGLLGPRLQTSRGGFYFEVLAGTTDIPQIRVMSTARLGGVIPLYAPLELGLDVGAMYLDLDDSGVFEANHVAKINYSASSQLMLRF